MNKREAALEIFLAGVESVKPHNLIHRYVSISGGTLHFEKIAFNLSELNDIYVVGAGKAATSMAGALEAVIGSRIRAGQIITKYRHSSPLKYIKTTEAGHPVPDENGIKGTKKILSLMKKTGKDDLVICLISGGGSALLADVPEGCDLDDLKAVNNILLRSGANINEMNCVRKHLSKVKGGHLAIAASPSKVVSLILSDVIGDPLDVIASGPTAPDPTTFGDALSVIRKYNIRKEIPEKIFQFLKKGSEMNRSETLKETDEILHHTYNLVIGTNKLALAHASAKAESLGYESHILTYTLEGDVAAVADHIITIVKKTQKEQVGKKVCLLLGGEPTVRVNGKGMGGRNQHLALLMVRFLKDLPGVTILSGGTDGNDGPTDAAGAVADSMTAKYAINTHLEIEKFIDDCDSYNFFRQEGGLIKTGPTQTNVMDIIVVLIEKEV